MLKTQIVIDIDNQIVSVYAAQPDDLDVILVDWDNEGVDPRSSDSVELFRRGGLHSACVLALPVLPIHELAGSDTEQAIEIADEQGAFPESAGATC